MSVIYDALSVTVNHIIGTTDTVADTGIGNLMKGTKALQEFLHGVDVEVADSPLEIVPLHAIDHIIVEAERTTDEPTDTTCEDNCDEMTDPTLIVPDTAIEVGTGEYFDPLLGVTALDSNNHRIIPTVTLDEEYLLTEDSVPISDDNSDDIVAG